jgi:hypothetical protein
VADQVLIRVAASSLNPLEYKLADLNFMARLGCGNPLGGKRAVRGVRTVVFAASGVLKAGLGSAFGYGWAIRKSHIDVCRRQMYGVDRG